MDLWTLLHRWNERPMGRPISALLVGLALGLLATLLVSPGSTLQFHGAEYAELSANVFNGAYESRFRYRILAPFLGAISGLSGARFFVVPWIVGVLFLAATFHELRREGASLAMALLAASAMASSCTTLLPLSSPGYTDTLTYFFLLLAFFRTEQVVFSATCFALALWNHESAAFLFPGLLLFHHSRQGDANRTRNYATLLLLFVIPYGAYRLWVGEHFTEALGAAWYLNSENIRISSAEVKLLAPLGAFLAFKFFWGFPAWAIAIAWRNKQRIVLGTYVAILVAVSMQQLVAVDTTRLFTLAFPLVLLAMLQLDRSAQRGLALRIGVLVMLANILLPAAMVASDRVFLLGAVVQ